MDLNKKKYFFIRFFGLKKKKNKGVFMYVNKGDNNLTPNNIDESNVATDIGVECPDCKSMHIKISFMISGFYDCKCRSCGAQFVVPIRRYVRPKFGYPRSSSTWDEQRLLFGLNDEIFREFLPFFSFLAFSILAIVASVSMNSFLSYPFATVAIISLLIFVVGKIRRVR